MDVQKLSGPSAASASLTLRPVPRDAAGSGLKTADTERARLTQIEQSLSAQFPPQVKLQLDIDRTTGTVIGRVVDKKTGELVRQIPSEEIIALMARSAEISALLDKKV